MSAGRLTACLLAIAVLVLAIAAGSEAASSGPQARHQLGDVALPLAPVGSPFSFQFESSLRPEPQFSVSAGKLPDGLALAGDGLLSGTPTAPGDSSFTVKASNGDAPSVEQALTMEVVGGPLLDLGAAYGITPTAAELTASIDPRNLAATAWFEYWPVSDTPQIPIWTEPRPVAKGVVPVGLSSQVSALAPGTEYLYRVSAANELSPDPVHSATRVLRTTDPGLPPPTAGETFNLEPVDGTTSTKCAGEQDFSKLNAPKQVTLDCEVDTSDGTVSLTASKGSSGETQTALFWGGLFEVDQKAGDDQAAVLSLSGKRRCERRKSGKGHRPHRLSRKGGGGRKLWGSGGGNYKTVGSHGAATVRGTIWLVRDRCDGSTQFKVKEGKVVVRDFVAKTTVTLEAGQDYVAQAEPDRLP